MPYQPVPMKDLSGYLLPEQVQRIIEACDNERDKALLTVLAYTGRRVSEVVRSLKPRDIRWQDGLIEWTILKKNPRRRRDDGTFTPKSEPVRKLKPVRKEVLSSLSKHIKRFGIRDDEFVFTINKHRVYQIVKAAGERARITHVGNKPLHPHVFRHSFIVEAAKKARKPEDIRMIQQMAEHARVDTTMEYLQFNPEYQRELLGRMFKPESKGNDSDDRKTS